MDIINVQDLTFKYEQDRRLIFDKTNLVIQENDFVGIIGGNGSGKSTLLKLIVGLYKPQSGTILVWGKQPKHALNKIGYVSQHEDIDFNFPITMYELVEMGRLKNKFVNKYGQDDTKNVRDQMQMLGIWNLKNKLIREVSGGQRQRGFLARALVSNAKLLILDEPLANLDIKVRKEFFDLLKQLNKNITIIVVDHNQEILSEYCDKIVCVDKCEHHSVKMHKGETLMLGGTNGNC